MLWVCVLITFSLICIIALVVISAINTNKKTDRMIENLDTLVEQMIIAMAWMDRFDRSQAELKADFDKKLGADLAQKVKLILDAGKHPSKLMLGKDNKLHKINREY